MMESLEAAPSVNDRAGIFTMLRSNGEICCADASLLSTIPKADQVLCSSPQHLRASSTLRFFQTHAFFVEELSRTGQEPRYAVYTNCLIHASLKWIRTHAFQLAASKPGEYAPKLPARLASYIDAAPGRKLGCFHSEGYLNLVHDAAVRAGFEPQPDLSFLLPRRLRLPRPRVQNHRHAPRHGRRGRRPPSAAWSRCSGPSP